MRITGGSARGRRLLPPARGKRSIRPTTDRAREALFNILAGRINGSIVLDLYAGTGAIGLETLSRGADMVYFADHDPAALTLIGRNLQACFSAPPARVFRLDLSRTSSWHVLRTALGPERLCDLVFLDPPYEKKLARQALAMVDTTGLTAEDGLVIAEERSRLELPQQVGRLHLTDRRRYGETGFWIYELRDAP